MPSFVNWVTLTLDGEAVKVKTNAGDQLTAERALNGPLMEHQAELGMRVWYSALRRQHPDHPASKSFRAFVEALEGADEEDETATRDDLDPTQPVGSDD